MVMVTAGVYAQDIMQLGELERVIETNLSKSVLYANAQQWASANDPAAKKNIEMQDNENGSLIVSVKLNNNYSIANSQTTYLTYQFRFSVKIDCKDGKYRYIISNPSVLVANDDNINIERMPTSLLIKYREELKAIVSISEKHFQKILDWELYKVLEVLNVNNRNIAELTNQEQDPNISKKERKFAKNKIEALNKQNIIFQEVFNRWSVSLNETTKGLVETMKLSNDF